ncbi:hypothetical protein D920_01887 [Enterococcus faecalis 13-SD-W-01]|nr:hypothetical protein D920_01887 [Enterococcus faecalis 13-SD-W-01]
MKETFDFLIKILPGGTPMGKFKALVGTLLMIMLAVQYLKIKISRKRITEEEEAKKIEELYEKNDDGLYPWEEDMDDSPNRIAKDARQISNDWMPKRGRWN